jgi:hypothetical protein
MPVPERIQLRRTKGWRLQAGAIKVDRSTRWGNPYVIGEPMDLVCLRRWGFQIKHTEFQATNREEAVTLFAALLAFDGAARDMIRRELAGKDLACWCPLPNPGERDICHAAVLLKIANSVKP